MVKADALKVQQVPRWSWPLDLCLTHLPHATHDSQHN